MVRNSHHASGIFDNLRALFGSTNSGYERLDVNELTLSVLRIVREDLVEHDIAAEVELAPNLPLIMGHRGQLQEVLINLVRNAIEAMSDIRDGHRILHVGTDCHDNKAIIISVLTLDRESIQWFWIVSLKFLSQQKQAAWDWGSLFAA